MTLISKSRVLLYNDKQSIHRPSKFLIDWKPAMGIFCIWKTYIWASFDKGKSITFWHWSNINIYILYLGLEMNDTSLENPAIAYPSLGISYLAFHEVPKAWDCLHKFCEKSFRVGGSCLDPQDLLVLRVRVLEILIYFWINQHFALVEHSFNLIKFLTDDNPINLNGIWF